MLRRLCVTILVLAGSIAPAAAAGIEYVTVQAEGSATILPSEAMAAMDTQNESTFASASVTAE